MSKADTRVQVVLYLAALLCGIAVIGVVGPRAWLEGWLRTQYHAQAAPDAVHLYGLRVACATYAFAGLYFLIIARRPSEYAQFVNLGATGLVFVGIVAFIAGAGLKLPFWGYFIDVALFWVLGLLLFALSPRRRRGRSKRRSSSRSGESSSSGSSGRRRKKRRVWRGTPPDVDFRRETRGDGRVD